MDSENQENTEPIDWEGESGDSGINSLNYEESSQSQTQSEPDYWGRLYPLSSSLELINLVNNTPMTFGKVDTDVILSRENLPVGVYNKVSKVHFELQRKQVKIVGAPTTQVVLTDKSSNGTFINGHVLRKKASGKARCKTLRSHDVIGLPAGNPVIYDAYVFVDSLMATSSPVPSSVRAKYVVSNRLGVGAFGEVSLVFNKITGRPFAMKTIVKDVYTHTHIVDSYTKKLRNEINILQKVKHPNIIQLVDVLDCKKEHFLVLEFMEGKDLSYRLKQSGKLEENLAKLYFYQAVKGVEYLHSRGIIHRDLKPENMLLSSSKRETILKITDFGLSKVLSPITIMKTLCGTKLFVAPEVLCGGGTDEYTKQVDIWSMGVILYLCLCGTGPFQSDTDSIEKLIKEAVIDMPTCDWKSVSEEAKHLVRRMLVKEPQDRIRINDIIGDKWMQDTRMLKTVDELYGALARMNSSESSQDSFSMDIETTICSSEDLSSQSNTFERPSSPPLKRLKIN